MIAKPKKIKLSSLAKKCDRALQDIGREVYKTCMVCGAPMSCLHHYYPKSMSQTLRYDWDNCVPLCQGCHFAHHNGNPEIHERVAYYRGAEWLNALKLKKKKITKVSRSYYEGILSSLSQLRETLSNDKSL